MLPRGRSGVESGPKRDRQRRLLCACQKRTQTLLALRHCSVSSSGFRYSASCELQANPSNHCYGTHVCRRGVRRRARRGASLVMARHTYGGERCRGVPECVRRVATRVRIRDVQDVGRSSLGAVWVSRGAPVRRRAHDAIDRNHGGRSPAANCPRHTNCCSGPDVHRSWKRGVS